MNISKRVHRLRWGGVAAVSAIAFTLLLAASRNQPEFHFAMLGDRTGEAQAGVYEEAWREATAEHPAFVLTVGDTIQGYDDRTMDSEWQHVNHILAPFQKYKLFLTPGNHDVWDAASALEYQKFAGHPLHYSFDWEQAHFAILNDSQSDELKPDELAFLESDLAAHQRQPIKFIVSHRPSWLFRVVLHDTTFPLHRLALKYGVKYVIAGHIHKMVRFDLDGVTYLSLGSSGGHLREDKAYARGWFFQHTTVEVSDGIHMRIKELAPPFGEGRSTAPEDWNAQGLVH